MFTAPIFVWHAMQPAESTEKVDLSPAIILAILDAVVWLSIAAAASAI
jgi:hypothetical protein